MKSPIVVLMGGTSSEREISLATGQGVLQALRSLGYPAVSLDYDGTLVDELRRLRPAAVFNALHGGAGEDGTVQAVLDWLGIPYQGSGIRACAVAMDKWLTKALLLAEGLPCPRGRRVSAAESASFKVEEELGFPCVVKPNAEGSAVGVSIVRDAAAWSEAIANASIGGEDVLVEEYLEGREFTVAILGGTALPVVEITPHDTFYSYHAKYTPGQSTHIAPARIDAEFAERMQHDALALHCALGCRDYSRIDMIMSASGKLAVLECNALPGLTPLSLFPDAARAAGISYESLVERLLLCALSRQSNGPSAP